MLCISPVYLIFAIYLCTTFYCCMCTYKANHYDMQGKWHGYLSFKYKWLLILDDLVSITTERIETSIGRLIHVSILNIQQVMRLKTSFIGSMCVFFFSCESNN